MCNPLLTLPSSESSCVLWNRNYRICWLHVRKVTVSVRVVRKAILGPQAKFGFGVTHWISPVVYHRSTVRGVYFLLDTTCYRYDTEVIYLLSVISCIPRILHGGGDLFFEVLISQKVPWSYDSVGFRVGVFQGWSIIIQVC